MSLLSCFLLAVCSADLESQISRDLDLEAPTVVASAAVGDSIRRLDELKLTFSETVEGAGRLSAYVLSGDGIGTLTIEQVRVESNNTIILQFSGIPSDGEIRLQIRGVSDLVGNTLSNSLLTWQGDGLPKWRYLGRSISRGLVNVTQIPIETYGDFIYLAYSDESCQQNFGYYDATVMRIHIKTRRTELIGLPCIIGTVQASSNIQAMVLVDGNPIVAFRDTSSTDSNKISVKRWYNNSWEYLGSPRFTPNALSPDLRLAGDRLYLSFRDSSSSPTNRLRIYYIDLATAGSDWQELENLLLSQANVFTKVSMMMYDDKLFFSFRDGSTTPPLAVRYYDLSGAAYSAALNIGTFSALDTTVHMTDHPTIPIVAFSYRPFNTNIALRAYDGDGWLPADWTSAIPELDIGTTSAANNLQCRFRGNQPFCAYVEGTGFIYIRTYTESGGWEHVRGPGAADSAINGGNPGLLLTESAIYLAIRDKEVGFTNTLSLLSYE